MPNSKYLNLFCESVMTPTPTPYAPNTEPSKVPTVVFVVFDVDNSPIFSPRGVVLNAYSSQGLIDNYANDLYNLIKNANEIYSIIPELYTQNITKLDTKEYYDYIKNNGVLHSKPEELSTEDIVYNDILDRDPDFEISEI